MATADWVAPFGELCKMTHTNQAKWFLNGFWDSGMEAEKENIWIFANHFIEIESGKKVLYGTKKMVSNEKCDLDELQAHKFLEKLGETLTVKQLRAKLKKLDIDSNNRLCLLEYLLSKYQQSPQSLVDSPQGGVPPEVMEEAQQKCDQAQEAIDTAAEAANLAAANKTKATIAANDAKRLADASAEAAKDAATALAESEQKAKDAAESLEQSNQKAAAAAEAVKAQEVAEAEQKAAEANVKAAVDALELEEATYHGKIAKLENKLKDGKLSTVKRGSAVQKLAQLKDEDPLPLRKAKITQGSVLKKSKKATKKCAKLTEKCREVQKAAEDAAATAATAKQEADDAAAASAIAKEEADAAAVKAQEGAEAAAASLVVAEESEEKASAALESAQELFAAANAALDDLKNDDTPPNGAIWWMERIMTEKEKFMPRRKRKKKN